MFGCTLSINSYGMFTMLHKTFVSSIWNLTQLNKWKCLAKISRKYAPELMHLPLIQNYLENCAVFYPMLQNTFYFVLNAYFHYIVSNVDLVQVLLIHYENYCYTIFNANFIAESALRCPKFQMMPMQSQSHFW